MSTTPIQREESSVTLNYLLRRMRHKTDFPALGTAMTRVHALSDSETDNLQTLCDAILQDVALTQKLLRVVNTAYYRRDGRDPISTVSRAVSLIGVSGVRNLALSLILLDHMEDKQHALHLKEEFLRTVMAGTLASELSSNLTEAEDAYVTALFSNLGRLLVAYYLPEDAEEIRDRCKPEPHSPQSQQPCESQAAIQILGMGYEVLGQAIGREWGFNETLIDTMGMVPSAPVPQHSMAARPERTGWLAALGNRASIDMLRSDPALLGNRLEHLQQLYQAPLELKAGAVQAAAGRARKRLSELTQVLNLSVPRDSNAERLLEDFYVDAPNAGQSDQIRPETLGLAGEDGALPELDLVITENPSEVLNSGIQDITNAMADSFKLNEVLQMILETMLRALDCQRVIFCLRDAKSCALVGRIGLGDRADVLKGLFRVPLASNVTAPDLFSAMCLKGVDSLIADSSVPSIRARLPLWFRQNVNAPTFLLLPLVVKRANKDVVLGLVYADKAKAESLLINEKELSLLRTLRNQAVLAFKNAASS